ncbi:TonB-dependent receptor [Flagellimonas sp. 389]|uniref:TonB-dependent receptor n=1 Tax=Flagellimonas sp. 389 TaxID=2835862 RepID=UPI001BD5E539|nr:TonB-dependent receptor [Flagellimonas sp. 389]MBS9463463.1 TonB-dependent receptor [Flagellimonas sp. 389]
MRLLFLLICLTMVNVALGQNEGKRISLSFDDITISEALSKIEEVTDYEFYYLEEWLGTNLVSGEYDSTIDVILEDILGKIEVNFYMLEANKVVLTKNSIVYDSLPEVFQKNNLNDTVKNQDFRLLDEADIPILAIRSDSNSPTTIETFRVGKRNRGQRSRTATLKGIILNGTTGDPIPDLQIVVRNENRAAITNTDGAYEIRLPLGTHILEMIALGIENTKKRVVIYNDGSLDFTLNESLELLDEVIVEADADKNVANTTSGSERIDAEESKNIPLVLGERDVLRVATSLPGISTAGEGSAGFNVRGGKSDQNLILLDDAVVYNPQHFFGIFSALNPFAISSLNVYKGSFPSEYGGRLSSVFDIKTKNADVETIKGEASIGPVTSNAVIELPVIKDKSSLLLGGRGAYANWILRSLDEPDLENSEASFYDFLANYNHKINSNNSIKATGYYSRDDFSITSDSLFVYKNQLVSLKWDHAFNEKTTSSLVASNSQYDFDIEFDGDSNDDFLFGYKVNESEVKLKINHIKDSKFSYNYGIASKLYNIDPGDIEPLDENNSIVEPRSINRERGLESAFFVSANLDITDKLSVEAGVRLSNFLALGQGSQAVFEEGQPRNQGSIIDTLDFERNEVIESFFNPEPRISARYLLNPSLSIKGGYGRTYQYIHRLSNNTTVSPIDTWKISDSNIKPQSADQFTLGLFKNIDGNTFELSLEGFYKRSDNILDFKTGAQILLNENIVLETLQGEGESYGVEFLIRKNKGKLNGWLGYTYSRSFIKFDSEFPEEQINNGDFFPSNFDKPHDLSLVTNYKFSKRFSLSTNFTYQTGRPVTVPVGSFSFDNSEFVVFSDRNSFRIPDFYRLDIGLNIEGNHKIKKFAHSFWTISIYNVLGRNNPFSVFFVTENGEVQGQQASIFNIPVPSITYNFKF